MTTTWIRVTPCSSIPLREGRAVRLGEREIALFNLGNRFLAVDNSCPHQGGPLCDGIVTGDSVVCPLHAWRINLERGGVERPSHATHNCVRTYPTRIDAGIVLVQLDRPAPEERVVDTAVGLTHDAFDTGNVFAR